MPTVSMCICVNFYVQLDLTVNYHFLFIYFYLKKNRKKGTRTCYGIINDENECVCMFINWKKYCVDVSIGFSFILNNIFH